MSDYIPVKRNEDGKYIPCEWSEATGFAEPNDNQSGAGLARVQANLLLSIMDGHGLQHATLRSLLGQIVDDPVSFFRAR